MQVLSFIQTDTLSLVALFFFLLLDSFNMFVLFIFITTLFTYN